jgi:hypothetical protein
MPAFVGKNRAVLGIDAGPLYLFADEFTTALAAGSVNGTVAEPGPGLLRIVTDGNSKLSIAAGLLSFATGGVGQGNPGVWYSAVMRRAGVLIIGSVASTSSSLALGFDSGTAGQLHDSLLLNSTNLAAVVNSAAGINVAPVTTSTAYKLAVVLRATGSIHLIKGGAYTNWTLVWIGAAGAYVSANPGCIVNNATSVATVDYLRIPTALWLPTPLASDGFASAFGFTDGLGHPEGVLGGIGNGGVSLAWTQQVGAWTVAGGKANASALSGGIAIATVPTSTADVLAEVKVTRAAGQGGLVLRYTDANNYLYANHDGTNAFLKQVLSGSTTTLITAAATYSAGAVLRVDLSGVNGRLYYNNALVSSATASINAGLTATAHGLYVTDTTVQLDDCVIYAKGTANEYAILDNY